MAPKEPLIPKHGGYRNLKSFRVAQLVYDMTVRFCDRYVEKFSRTRDQMVQAARSGVQNIAEGSHASAASKKMELKLTSVARASLEELRLDYEDFLRHRQLPILTANHPVLVRFKNRRCKTLKDVQAWVAEERRLCLETRADSRPGSHGSHAGSCGRNMDKHGQTRTNTDPRAGEVPQTVRDQTHTPPMPSSALAANAVLSLLNLACYFLDRQIATQAKCFEEEGGFTERLYRVRTNYRKNKPRPR